MSWEQHSFIMRKVRAFLVPHAEHVLSFAAMEVSHKRYIPQSPCSYTVHICAYIGTLLTPGRYRAYINPLGIKKSERHVDYTRNSGGPS